MAKPILIIDFGSTSVRAGIVTPRQWKLAWSAEVPVNLPAKDFGAGVKDSAAEALSALLQTIQLTGFRRFSRILVGLPPAMMSLRIIALPFSDKKKLAEVLPFEVRDVFTKDIEEMALAALPLSDNRIMAVAVGKRDIQEYMDMLRKHGLEPSWVGAALFSKDKLLRKLYTGDEGAAFIDSDSLVVMHKGKPYLFKDIKDITELRLALASVEEDGIEITKFYATSKQAELLKTIGKNATVARQYEDRQTGLLAIACHAGEGLRDAVNFCTGEFTDAKEIKSAQKWHKIVATLLIALTSLWGGYIYLRYQTLNTSLTQSTNKLDKAYRKLFPEDVKVVDALHQMEIKLKELREEEKIIKSGINVLEIMRQLSDGAGKVDKVRLFSLHIHERRITANGEAASFEGANKFRDTVAGLSYFKDTLLTDVKATTQGGVSFSITLSLKDEI